MAVYTPDGAGNLIPRDGRGNRLQGQRSFRALTPKTKPFIQPPEPVAEEVQPARPLPPEPPSEGPSLAESVRVGAELTEGADQRESRSSAPSVVPGAIVDVTVPFPEPSGDGAGVIIGPAAPGDMVPSVALETEATPICALDGCTKALVKNKRGKFPKYCSDPHKAKAAYLRRKARTTGKGESHAGTSRGEPS